MCLKLPVHVILACAVSFLWEISLKAEVDLDQYRQAVLSQTNLIAYYTFDEGDASDSKGRFPGTVQGTFTNGLGAGKAFHCTGQSHVGLVGTLKEAQGIEMWVKADWEEWGRGDLDFTTDPCMLFIYYGLHLSRDKQVITLNFGGPLYQFYVTDVGTNWHHVVLNFRLGVASLYWDGQKVESFELRPHSTDTPWVTLGSGYQQGWIGAIDEFSFYTSPLDLETIRDHYALFLQRSPPIFKKKPVPKVTSVGQNIAFTSSAVSASAIHYQWYFKGALLPNETNTTLNISGVTTNDSGLYSLLATNQSGAASNCATLLVHDILWPQFKIRSLTTNNIVTFQTPHGTGWNVESLAAAAMSSAKTGATESAILEMFSNSDSPFPIPHFIVNDLKTGKLYQLGLTSIPFTGETLLEFLLPIDPFTYASNGPPIYLSPPINNGQFPSFFSGYGQLVVWSHSPIYPSDPKIGRSEVFSIDPANGRVQAFGKLPFPHFHSQEYLYPKTFGITISGVAEFWDGALHLVYVQDAQTVVRIRVPDGEVSEISRFSNLSRVQWMNFIPDLGRWLFFLEGPSFAGQAKSAVLADAYLEFPSLPRAPVVITQPADVLVTNGSTATLKIEVFGSPFPALQWLKNGTPLINETNDTLIFETVTANDSGRYSILASNNLGTCISSDAHLTIVEPGEGISNGSFERSNIHPWTFIEQPHFPRFPIVVRNGTHTDSFWGFIANAPDGDYSLIFTFHSDIAGVKQDVIVPGNASLLKFRYRASAYGSFPEINGAVFRTVVTEAGNPTISAVVTNVLPNRSDTGHLENMLSLRAFRGKPVEIKFELITYYQQVEIFTLQLDDVRFVADIDEYLGGKVEITTQSDGSIGLIFSELPFPSIIEASTNLVNWKAVSTNFNSQVNLNISTSGTGKVFYRARAVD